MNGRILATIALTSLLVLSLTVIATPPEAKRWALIVAPEHEGGTVYEDALDMYDYLKDQGWTDDEIIFLTDGSEESFVDGDASADEIFKAFSHLAMNVESLDTVVIVLGDNGACGHEDYYLISSDDVQISSWDIGLKLDAIHANEMAVVVSFDYSGGFVKSLAGDGRLILTSHGTESSSGNAYNLADGLTEEDADANMDGIVSFEEAHDYIAEDISGQSPQKSDNIYGEFTI